MTLVADHDALHLVLVGARLLHHAHKLGVQTLLALGWRPCQAHVVVGHRHFVGARERARVQTDRLDVLLGRVLVGVRLRCHVGCHVLLFCELFLGVVGAAHSRIGAREHVRAAESVANVPTARLAVEKTRARRIDRRVRFCAPAGLHDCPQCVPNAKVKMWIRYVGHFGHYQVSSRFWPRT